LAFVPIVGLLLALALAVGGYAANTGGSESGEAPAPEPPETPAQTLPAPDAPLPRSARGLAAEFATTTADLYAAIDRWRGEGDPARGLPPHDVAHLALHQQRIVLRLMRAKRLYPRVLQALPRRLRPLLRDPVLARRELAAIHSVVVQRPRISIGRPQPADRLLTHYERAQRRFGVGWQLLAAVNMVETAFGRMRNESVSGARGPMQFMPATWRAYGLGGNVHRPRDAILGAANYLRASGAPGDESRALYAYNPSRLYVRAVSRYARRIRADRRTYYAYYAWQVFLRSKAGYRRASSHGLR
jgi:membrane-bound lytic murein transglycosylase B